MKWFPQLFWESVKKAGLERSFFDVYPEKKDKFVAGATTFEDLTIAARVFPAERDTLERKLLDVCTTPDNVIAFVKIFGPGSDVQSKWRRILLNSEAARPADFISYYASVGNPHPGDKALERAFVQAVGKHADTEATMPVGGRLPWGDYLRSYHRITGNNLKPFKNIWKEKIGKMSPLSKRELAAFLFVYPEERRKYENTMMTFSTVDGMRTYLDLYPQWGRQATYSKAKSLLDRVQGDSEAWQALDLMSERYPTLKERLRDDFRNAVLKLPRATAQTAETPGMIKIELANEEEIEESFAAFVGHFPGEKESLLEKIREAIKTAHAKAEADFRSPLRGFKPLPLPLGSKEVLEHLEQLGIPRPLLPLAVRDQAKPQGIPLLDEGATAWDDY